MNVLELPFNKEIGIQKADNETYIFMLEAHDKYSNHIGTVHASAQFALAEATSGEYLLCEFKEYCKNVIPMVRRVELKYSRPASGKVYSNASIDAEGKNRVITELDSKGRAIVKVMVQLRDEQGNLTMNSEFEWFIQKVDEQNLT